MSCKVALIGGTGMESLWERAGDRLEVSTNYGSVMGKRLILESGNHAIVFLRHGIEHKVPPAKVSYRAFGSACRDMGIQYCLATGAVGSLRADWGVGEMLVPNDFIDFTKRASVYEDEVLHTDFSDPFDGTCRKALLESCVELGCSVRDGGVYVGMPGPRYETPAEVVALRKLGGDVVGMTITSEAIAMKECGVRYACLVLVTNLAAGLGKKLTHEEVEARMLENGSLVISILMRAAERLCGE
ncbi:MAG TPA: MTAP family purine nucleoside phosphorylase [Fimbriimonadales bacterium]|nr:MTAP family purine nucleoside phosphorylase [Fimbriimonadales bacterium]